MIIKSSDRIKNIKPYYFAGKMAEIAEMNKRGLNVLNIGVGSPDLMPGNNVVQTMVSSVQNPTNHGYQPYKGIEELRVSFSGWYKRYFDVQINPYEEIQILMGSKEGIMHIAMTYLDKGDKVLVPDPGYPAYASASMLAGAEVIKYDLNAENNWLPDFDTLSKQDLSAVKIMWLNYPHMPTGAPATLHLFEEAIDFAIKNNILLVNDNPYNFILNDNPVSILQAVDSKKVALELVSMSKSYNMAGWRIGAVLGDKEYIDEIIKFKSNMDSGMFKPVQLAAVAALNSEDEWFEKLNGLYKKRRYKVWEIMDHLNCRYSRESTGMFVWGKTQNSNEEEFIENILQKARVFITPGRIFGNNGKGYIRISLTNSIEKLETALERIKNITG